MAVRFNAVDEHYTAITGVPSEAFTITFWAKLSADSNDFQSLANIDNGSTDQTIIVQTNNDGTTLGLYTTQSNFVSLSPMTVGTWYKVALTKNGSIGIIYSALGTESTLISDDAVVSTQTLTRLRIGMSAYSGEWLNGCMTAFKMWDAVLTEQEIEQELVQYEPLRTTNLVRYHPFHVAETTDHSGNGYTLLGGTGASTEPGPTELINAINKNSTDSFTVTEQSTVESDQNIDSSDSFTVDDQASVFSEISNLTVRSLKTYEFDVPRSTSSFQISNGDDAVEGEFLVALIPWTYDNDGQNAFVTMPGWDLAASANALGNSSSPNANIFTRIATNNEPSSYTVNKWSSGGTTTSDFACQIIAFTSANPASPFISDITFSTSNVGSSSTVPAITPDGQPYMAVWAIFDQWYNTQKSSDFTWSPTPIKLSQIVGIYTMSSTAYEYLTDDSPTGTRSVSISPYQNTNRQSLVVSFGIRQASSAVFVDKSSTDVFTFSEALSDTIIREDSFTFIENATVVQDKVTTDREDFIFTDTSEIQKSFDIFSSDQFTLFNLVGDRDIDTSDLFTYHGESSGELDLTTTDSFIFTDTANLVGDEPGNVNLYDVVTYPLPRKTLPFRLIAQNIFTKQFIHWDLPVDDATIRRTISGPTIITAAINTENQSLQSLDPPLEPNATWIHVEEDGVILASGILLPFGDDNSAKTRTIEAEGPSTYPHWITYQGEPFYGVQVDPADMVRKIWEHVQSYEDGDLGVQVSNTKTPVLIGTEPENVDFETGEGEDVAFIAGPYMLNFWAVKNCGTEIANLCKETPIEYREHSQWNPTKTDVIHRIELGYPRIGGQRIELGFREGENFYNLIPEYPENKDTYASEVIVVGAGDGPDAIREITYGRTFPPRLRKTHVLQNEDITSHERAKAMSQFEFRRRRLTHYEIKSITIDTTHPNARYGTYHEGDDILVEGYIQYIGKIADLHRIVSHTYNPRHKTATLELKPSESFAYGALKVDPLGPE